MNPLLGPAKRILVFVAADGHIGSVSDSSLVRRAALDLRAAVAEVEAREAVTDPGKGPGHPAKEPT